MSFGARLTGVAGERGWACLGIDPHPQLLLEWGLTDDLVGLERFALTCVEAFAGLAAVVKPQSAFFERFGSRGIAILEHTVAEARAAGALVLLDVKRGDIGSTMTAYAEAYLDPGSSLAVDAITLSPFLGVGSLEPAFDLALRHRAGVFVLAMTSNKEGEQVQQARLADGRTVAQSVIDEVAERNAGTEPLGSFGLVVGATVDGSVADLSGLNGPCLIPGIGAQGGTAADVRRIFGDHGRAVLPSVSRELLAAGPSVTALGARAERYIADYGWLLR